jgi:hypothetical protein
MPLPGTENCTVAKAMCPAREIWPGAPYGPVTELTPAACSKGSSAREIRSRVAGAEIGWADRIASVSASPDCRWKCAFSSGLLSHLASSAGPVGTSCGGRHLASPLLSPVYFRGSTPRTYAESGAQMSGAQME